MENMTVAQLKEVAQRKGVEVKSKATKAEIIAALKKTEKKAKAGKKVSGEY